MAPDSLYGRCVQEAAKICGGYAELSQHLGIPQRILMLWQDGSGTPPQAVFLRIVDIIFSPDEAVLDRSRRGLCNSD